MSIDDDQARKLAGDNLLLTFINLLEELQHYPLCSMLQKARRAPSARDAELELDALQDMLRDIGRPQLAAALQPIVAAYYGPPPEAPQLTQAAPPTDPDAAALRYMLNEMRCRVEYGADSNGQLEGLLYLYQERHFHQQARQQ